MHFFNDRHKILQNKGKKIVVLKIQKAHVISQDKNYEIDLWLLNEIYDFLSIEFMAFKS